MPRYCSSRVVVALLSTALVLTFSAESVIAEDAAWPQWRGPNRDGKAPPSSIRTDWEKNAPALEWKADGFGTGYASISAMDGVLYTTGNLNDGQYAFAASQKNGDITWKRRLTDVPPKHGYQGSRCTPTIAGDHLYIVTSNGEIHCLTRATGNIVWSRDFKKDFDGKMHSGWGFSESPLVDGDRVICTPGGPDAVLVALDRKTGDTIWQSSMPDLGGKSGAGYSSIVISNGAGVKQYVQLVGQGVIGVRASDGEYLWGYSRVANRTANIPTSVIMGDLVFASSGYGTGAALLKLSKDGDGVKAEEQYFLNATTFQCHHGGMIDIDGYIYSGTGHNNGFPTCLDVKTGEIVWGGKLRGPGQKSAVITLVDGHLIFRYQSGEIALIEATTSGYNLKGVFTPDVVDKSPSWSQVIVLDGKLYFRENGVMMCYDATK